MALKGKSLSAVDQPGTLSDPRVVGTVFLFASLAVMVITLALGLFIQSTWSYLLCVAIYAIKIRVEIRYGIVSPISISVALAYMTVAFLSILGYDTTGYVGVGIFAWLFMVAATLHAAGRPFTSFYAKGRSVQIIHKVVSWTWILAYGAAFLASWLLMPNPLFVILPIVISFGAAATTLFANLVWCGRSNQLRTSYLEDGLHFVEITPASREFNSYLQMYAANLIQHPEQSHSVKSLEDTERSIRASELKLGNRVRIMICKDRERLIGCIRCVVDKRSEHLPTERELNSSFEELRKHGRLMEVGRLAVDEEYRNRPVVLNGLLRYFVNVALDEDVSYIISSGFKYVAPTYAKMGFEMLFRKSDRRYNQVRSHGYISYPMFLSFEKLIFERGKEDSLKYGMYEMAQPYLAERWFKRALIRRFLKTILSRPAMLEAAEVKQLLQKDTVLTH